MIDSHTHIDMCPAPAGEVVAEARAAGVSRMLTIGMDADNARVAIELARTYDEVFAAVGRHPNAAAGFTDDDAEVIRALVASAPDAVLAVGETGLDFYRDRATRADQEHAFRAQIEIAREVGKPLVIHTRAAEEATLDLLAAEADGIPTILHCFSMPDRLDECLERGYWISFAGNVTYPKATDLAAAAERVPLDRLLVETDAPYLTPQVVRKHRNQPAYVVHTAQFIAQRRGLATEELAAAIDATAAALLGW